MLRRTLLAVAVTAAVVATPTSQAAGPRVSLSVSAFEVTHGASIVLSGAVGTREAGVAVTVLARQFTSSGFRRVATVETGADGEWSYSVTPTVATTYRVRAGGPTSRLLTVGVRPAISITRDPNGRLELRLTPDAFSGRFVRIQQQQADESWTNVLNVRLGSRSGAAVSPNRLSTSAQTLRVALSVNQAGAGYLGSTSDPLDYPARWASLSTPASEIAYGETVTLSGMVSARQAGVPVTILIRPVAKAEFHPRTTVTTGPGGHWSYTLKPWVSAEIQARFGAGGSRVLPVGVRPAVSVQVVSGGRIWSKVAAGRSLAGKAVQLQQELADGTWKTLARARLDRQSEAVFPVSAVPGGNSTLRVAMSVNQAGAGYLAGFSNSFVYQR